MDRSDAVLAEQIRNLQEKITDLKEDIRLIKSEVDSIYDLMSRWRWSFSIIVAIGGFIGWVASFWDRIPFPKGK